MRKSLGIGHQDFEQMISDALLSKKKVIILLDECDPPMQEASYYSITRDIAVGNT